MVHQVDVARRSLRRVILLRQRWTSSSHTRRLFSSVSSFNSSNSKVSTRSRSSSIAHQSLVSSVPNLQALQRVRWLLQQPQRRVLLLTSSSDSPVRAALERDVPAFELERRGHGVFGVREFCQLLLRESGRERRVYGRAQLAALLLHDGLALPDANRLAATSTLQRRKGVQDLLQLFQLLEREGVTPEQYRAAADRGLAETYRNYHELLMQHNATSWDGLVADVLALCGVQKGGVAVETTAHEFSQAVLKEYTDVVVDDVQRMTPAMATLVGHLCGQPSVQSSASFSRVLQQGDECPRTQILERQLLKTAADTGCERNFSPIASVQGEDVEQRVKMRAFAKQVLTGVNNGVSSPVPFKCWQFAVSEAEERGIGAFLAQTLEAGGTTHITVLCPSYADAHRITMAFQKRGLPIQVESNQFAAATNSTGASIHLFDEPGVNAVYSLLCALCFPSDSRHLYNVLRSDFFAFPAELLSRLMEKEHRSHVDLFLVLEAFIKSHGKSLSTSLHQKEGEEQKLPRSVSLQLESGLQIAESFVNIIKRLRGECHLLSTAEIVQSFLEETDRLETLLSPNSLEQQRESLVLADFLRELETAQNVVKSDQVTFVAPYLQQLRETNLTSSASWEDTPEVGRTKATDKDTCIRVLPLTSYALESLATLTEGGNDNKRVLVLMSMRDSKFPGRMKRLTLPLPYDLLSKPYPVQTRTEHLQQCEQLAYEALTLGVYDEVVVSFAELASSKREVLSRTFQPIWHEGDQPPTTTSGKGRKGRTESSSVTSSPKIQSNEQPSANQVDPKKNEAPVRDNSHFLLSEMAGLLHKFMTHIFLPIVHQEKRQTAVDTSSGTKSANDEPIDSRWKRDAVDVKTAVSMVTETFTSTNMSAHRSSAPVTKMSYEPKHLSYSQISEYLRCPHRYYLGRVMKLDGDVSTSMMFGRALHEGIAAFAKSLAATQLSGDVTQEMKTLAAVEAEEAFMRAWAGDGYGLFSSKEQTTFLLERGMMALWEFIETHYGDLQLKEIVHVEQEFSFHVPEANVELRGVWDRIDRVSNPFGNGSSSFVIKEFKSNMAGTERNMRKLADDSLQLKMYMYAFRKVFGEAPYGAKLQQIGGNYNDPNTDDTKTKRKRISRTRNDDNGFVYFSKEAEQEAKDAIVEVVSGLRRGDFEPKPSFAECAFCPYAGSACHFASDDASQERQSARRVGAVAN